MDAGALKSRMISLNDVRGLEVVEGIDGDYNNADRITVKGATPLKEMVGS